MHSWGAWDASWFWSLTLIAITITVHVIGIGLIATGIEWLRAKLVHKSRRRFGNTPTAITVIVLVALLLACLHGIESLTWAVAYVRLGGFASSSDAALYSVDSMTTRGSSGLSPIHEWRMMGAAEAGDGMLLFGISTAFLFYVMTRFWRIELAR